MGVKYSLSLRLVFFLLLGLVCSLPARALDLRASATNSVTPSGLGNQFYAEISTLKTLDYGPENGKVIYAVMDPECAYCQSFDKEVMVRIAAGESIRFRALPVPILGKTSLDKVVRIYGAADPTLAWQHYIQTGKLPEAPIDVAKARAEKIIAQNLEWMMRWQIQMVPFLVWRDANERVIIHIGTTDNPEKFWQNLNAQ
jgi:hypothetical protein